MPFAPVPYEMKEFVAGELSKRTRYKEIIARCREKYGRGISIPTIRIIKQQYTPAPPVTTQVAHKTANADVLLQRAYKLLSESMQIAEEALFEHRVLTNRFKRGEIEAKDYDASIRRLRLPNMVQLAAIAKDLHALAHGKAKVPDMAKQPPDMGKLMQINDEIKLQQIVFTKNDKA